MTIVIEIPAIIINAVQEYLTNPIVKSVSSMTTKEKIIEALKRSLPMLPGDVVEEVKSMLTPEAIAIIAAVLVIWAGSHFFGIGEIVDVILLIVGSITLGVVAWTAGEKLINFANKAVNAVTEEDLNQAAKYFSDAIALIGVQIVMALLLKFRPKVFREPRNLMMHPPKTSILYTMKNIGIPPKTPGKIFYKPKTKEVKSLFKMGNSGGVTDQWGDSIILVSEVEDLARRAHFHERFHQFLAPKLQVFPRLRQFRAVLKNNSYLKSYILRYMEEALAETYAQVKVYGRWNMFKGLTFPVNNGYVTVAKMRTEAVGILLGPINVSGMAFNVYFAHSAPYQEGWQEYKPKP